MIPEDEIEDGGTEVWREVWWDRGTVTEVFEEDQASRRTGMRRKETHQQSDTLHISLVKSVHPILQFSS